MKKVRFESPLKLFNMNDSECHSPRPFIESHARLKPPDIQEFTRVVPYSPDPVRRFECSNSTPYPIVNKTCLGGIPENSTKYSPTSELELSLFDASCQEPRTHCRTILKVPERSGDNLKQTDYNSRPILSDYNSRPMLSSTNKTLTPPNVLSKDNSFFITRKDRDLNYFGINPIHTRFGRLSLDKENDPLARKSELVGNKSSLECKHSISPRRNSFSPNQAQYCSCHHCAKLVSNTACTRKPVCYETFQQKYCECCIPKPKKCQCDLRQKSPTVCNFVNAECHLCIPAVDAVDKKTLAIKRYEKNNPSNMEIVQQTQEAADKCEPTVLDLFKIIKLQNEQLQLLQEKVDKFIYATQNSQQHSEQKEILQSTEHKISIGVMTSFEMVQTSTVINKEIIKQTNENAQIQCNRSQISIKEVISKTQPVNINFLDGLTPPPKTAPETAPADSNVPNNANEEKTFNENSLYNVQVDNATTPFMSPEPSMYLEVRDYSDSDISNNDQSNVGWTYYNKVMTHVNGMLQDSDIPSSASALYRNARQCVQMQIDKTNVSVTKRVKFGDDPLGLHQPHIYAAPTDTSLKMNQLAAKYLKGQPCLTYQPQEKPTVEVRPVELSIATRNYMERHKLLPGTPKSPTYEIPRFLDITALKQQPKLL